MGYVKSVHTLHILVCLPGRLVGKLPITNISKSYTDLLQTIVDNEDLTTVSKYFIILYRSKTYQMILKLFVEVQAFGRYVSDRPTFICESNRKMPR